jgi:hypothetical protein
MAESWSARKISEPEKQNKYFRSSARNAGGSALIENVLDFSRIEQGPEAI